MVLTVPTMQSDENLKLNRAGSYTQGVQDRTQVVRNDAISDPIGTHRDHNVDEKPMPVSRAFDQVGVLRLVIAIFVLKGLKNLAVLIYH